MCSWNVGNAQPPKVRSKLQQWIPEGGGDFDVIAVGLQESSYREKHGDEKEDQEARDTEDTTKADDSDDEEVECSTINEDVGDEEHEEEDYEDVPLPTDEAEEEESKTSDVVIVKRSRSKKSMLKVSKIVKQMSSNIRETVATVADVLEYPFLKQLVQHVGDNYALVARVELMEMRLFVFALARHNVTQVEKLSVPTGLGSVIGNKVHCLVSDAKACDKSRLIAVCDIIGRAFGQIRDRKHVFMFCELSPCGPPGPEVSRKAQCRCKLL